MKKICKKILFTLGFFVIFIIWTILIKVIDVKAIGPNKSYVGFATLNGWFHNLIGDNMLLYAITDWLGLVPIFVCLIFAVIGLIQLIKRRSLFKVDKDIIILGIFYIIVIALYFLFEMIAINYRPILIDGNLEASYPSSTTLLVLTVMPTSIIECNLKLTNKKIKAILNTFNILFIIFMVAGRLVSGVHWLTDIVGGVFLSAALVLIYYTALSIDFNKCKKEKINEKKSIIKEDKIIEENKTIEEKKINEEEIIMKNSIQKGIEKRDQFFDSD